MRAAAVRSARVVQTEPQVRRDERNVAIGHAPEALAKLYPDLTDTRRAGKFAERQSTNPRPSPRRKPQALLIKIKLKAVSLKAVR